MNIPTVPTSKGAITLTELMPEHETWSPCEWNEFGPVCHLVALAQARATKRPGVDVAGVLVPADAQVALWDGSWKAAGNLSSGDKVVSWGNDDGVAMPYEMASAPTTSDSISCPGVAGEMLLRGDSLMIAVRL